jgi:hypothetical protein
MSEYDIQIEHRQNGTLNFNLCDHLGRPSRATGAFRMTQFPGLAVKTVQDEIRHADREPPFGSTEQLDFSGGRGWDDLERDKSRFYDSYRAQTWRDGIVILGSEEIYGKDIRDVVQEHWWDDNEDPSDGMARITLYDTTEYYSYKFTAVDDLDVDYIYLAGGVDTFNTGWNFKVDIYSDDGGDPDASLGSTGAVKPDAYEQVWRLAFTSTISLSSGTTYHVVVRNYEDVTHSGYEDYGFYVMGTYTVTAGDAKRSEDGSAWTNASYGIFFRLAADDPTFDIFGFEHLGATYFALSFHDGSDPKIFMNGERGSVTSSTSTVMTDSGASFTTDALIGAILLIYSGIGAEAERPWRVITDNDGTTITVDSAFEVTPGVGSKYVVVQSDVFTEVTGHEMTGRITDVMTFGNIVYFCKGDFDELYHMYDDTFDYEDNNKGTFIKAAYDNGNDAYKIFLARATFPPTIVTADPVYADYGLDIEDLVFTYEIQVADAGMGRDDGSWGTKGSTSGHARTESKAYKGRWSRVITADAADSGASQTLTVEDGATYKFTVHVWLNTLSNFKMEFDGVEIASTTTTGEWVRVEGYGVATGTTADLDFLSKADTGQFFYDAVWQEKVETPLPAGHDRITNLVNFGDPPVLHVFTDAGLLREASGGFIDISPSEMSTCGTPATARQL